MLRRFVLFVGCLCGSVAWGCSWVGDSEYRVLESDAGIGDRGDASSTMCSADDELCAEHSNCCGFATLRSRCVRSSTSLETQGRCRTLCETLCREGFFCALSERGREVCVLEEQ